MTLKVLLAAATLAFALIPGQSNSADTFSYLGMGQYSCGTWTKDRREKSILATLYQQWIVGFLSGVASVGSQFGISPLENTDTDGVWAWIDNYCATHPLDKIIDAGQAFVRAHPR